LEFYLQILRENPTQKTRLHMHTENKDSELKLYSMVFNSKDKERFFDMLRNLDRTREKLKFILPGGYGGEDIFMVEVELTESECAIMKLAFDFFSVNKIDNIK